MHKVIGATVFTLCLAPFAVAEPLAEDLSSKTDTELTELTAQWSNLSPGERRSLLAEVRGRMAANQKVRPPSGIRVQRRYGRVVRKSDGSVVVQTRVVEVRPRDPGATPGGTVTFGVGFEQRSKSRVQPVDDGPARQSPPTVTVGQQQTPDRDS